MRSGMIWLRTAVAAGALAIAGSAAFAQEKELVFGLQCDRTGATQTVGVFLCPGYHDYISLVNSKGGVEGYKIRVLEIDHEYKVPPAMEAHERFKKEGAVLHSLYGTPQTAALTKKLEEDKMLGTSPGFGTAAAADGKRYPYLFPLAASYWSQGAGRHRLRQEAARRQPQGQEDRLPLLRQSGQARSRWRSSTTSPSWRGSRCARSPFRRPASRWPRR